MADQKPVGAKPTSSAMAATRAACFPLRFPAEWHDGHADGEFLSSMDFKQPAGRKAVMAALNGDAVPLAELVNTEIAVIGLTCHPATKADEETGEIVRLIRCCLHLQDGRVAESFGHGVLKSVRILQTLDGDEMFAKPRRCTVRQIGTGGARSMYRLDWLD